MISPYPEINAEISSKEKLLWSGQPRQGLMFTSQDIFIIPFISIFIFVGIGLLLAGEENVNNESGLPFVIVPLLFFAFGVITLFGRPIKDIFRRKKTFYGVTDKRVIICSSKGVKSVPVSDAIELNYKHDRNNRGTITFGPDGGVSPFWGNQHSDLMATAPTSPTFESIEGGAQVYSQIKNVMGL